MLELWILFLWIYVPTNAKMSCDTNNNSSMSCCVPNCTIGNETSTCNEPCPDRLFKLMTTEPSEMCNMSSSNSSIIPEICVGTCPENFTIVTEGNSSRCIHCLKFCYIRYPNSSFDSWDSTTCICNDSNNESSTYFVRFDSTTNSYGSGSATKFMNTDKSWQHPDNVRKLTTVVYVMSGVCGLLVFLSLVAFICCCRWRDKYFKYKNSKVADDNGKKTKPNSTQQNFYQDMEVNGQRTDTTQQHIRSKDHADSINKDGQTSRGSNRQTYWKIGDVNDKISNESNRSVQSSNETNLNGKEDQAGEYVSIPIPPSSPDAEINIYDEALPQSKDAKNKMGLFKKVKITKNEEKENRTKKKREEKDSKFKIEAINKSADTKPSLNEYGDLPQCAEELHNITCLDNVRQNDARQEYIDMADVTQEKKGSQALGKIAKPFTIENGIHTPEVYETMTGKVSKKSIHTTETNTSDAYESMTGKVSKQANIKNDIHMPEVYETMTEKNLNVSSTFEQPVYESIPPKTKESTKTKSEPSQPDVIADTYAINTEFSKKIFSKATTTKKNKKAEKSKKDKKGKKSQPGWNMDEQCAYENNTNQTTTLSTVTLRLPRIDPDENKYESMTNVFQRPNPDKAVPSSVYHDAAPVIELIHTVARKCENKEGVSINEAVSIEAKKQENKSVSCIYDDATSVQKCRNDTLNEEKHTNEQPSKNMLPQILLHSVSADSQTFASATKPLLAEKSSNTVDANSKCPLSSDHDPNDITRSNSVMSPRGRRSSGSYDVISDVINDSSPLDVKNLQSETEWTDIKDIDDSSKEGNEVFTEIETPEVKEMNYQNRDDETEAKVVKGSSSPLKNCQSFREKLNRRLMKIEGLEHEEL